MSISFARSLNSSAVEVETYTTNTFRGTPTGYVRRVAAMLLFRWWWAVALPVAVCCLLAVNEAVWLFVAMMLVFLLYPGLTMMIYFNYAFSPEAQRTLYEQTVTVSKKNITVLYVEKNLTVTYSASDIAAVETGRNDILIRFKKPRYNHISIPLSAINDADKPHFFELLDAFIPTVA